MNDIVPATTRATALTPRTYEQAVEFATMMAKSSMVPQEYRGKPENILLALQLGAELGLSPLQAVQSIATVNGKPTVYGDAALALVRASPVCEDVIETTEGAGDDYAAVCTAKRRGKAPVVGRFSVADAKQAHLWGKQGPWQQYPRRMMQMRARSFALRDAFPDVLRGLIVAEEVQDYPREAVDVTPIGDTRADLDAFAGVAPPLPQHTLSHDAVREEEPDERSLRILEIDARSAAARGTEALRRHMRSLKPEDRDRLAGLVGSRQQPGELLRLARASDEALKAAEPEPDEEPTDPFGLPVAPRKDEAWWSARNLIVEAANPREFQARMHARIREARTADEIELLRASNAAIDTLDRATKEDILSALADRERELREKEC